MARKEYLASKRAGKQKDYSVKEYTPEECVIDLLKFVPFKYDDVVLDPSSGINEVWYTNFPTKNKLKCELDKNDDFFDFNDKVDWVVGNPPFTLFVKFLYKASEISEKGFAFLIGHSRLNQITTKRLHDFELRGFYLSKIHVCSIKKWFGRYYFIVFSRNPSPDITYGVKNY